MREYIHNLNTRIFSKYISEYITVLIVSTCLVGITVGSHNIGLPLYKINPMHWILYFVIILKRPALSTIIILAFALPFTSNILTGYPLMAKSFLILLELITYGVVFNLLLKNNSVILSYISSQVAGHIIYYSIKYFFIKTYIMKGILISSSIILQITMFIILGICIEIASRQQNKMVTNT